MSGCYFLIFIPQTGKLEKDERCSPLTSRARHRELTCNSLTPSAPSCWLGRDPIAEKGGLHLYGFVGNNPVCRWDVLGMEDGVVTMVPFVVTASRKTSDDSGLGIPLQQYADTPGRSEGVRPIFLR